MLDIDGFMTRICDLHKFKGKRYAKPLDFKICPKCNRKLDINEFYLRRSDSKTPRTFCKQCDLFYTKRRKAKKNKLNTDSMRSTAMATKGNKNLCTTK
jgi:hypothetical protein